MKILNKFKLKRSYYFHGELTELDRRISEITSDLVYKKSETEYTFFSRSSLGVLIVKGAHGITPPINVSAKITSINPNKHKVDFSSKIRIEHLFFVLFFGLMIYATFASNEPLTTLWFVMGLWLVFHLWFQFIYRIQEKGVVDEVAKIIRLRKSH